ncbi:carboxypeptidase [Vagococcus penaei]|uniref:Carboxypeptidase n=1 Tax=Vagococcus penaei TaxID=633807 RepID=A0A1Q2D3C3_9ENTE|nr:M20/M25/M40 family metallo-hydrolase [Vagococcus penaei]AQP52870.1 carboxypeptidase [Vagococcus penaei]RST97638.1 carboxypeptidase [Vagococcus penaei]
MVYLTHLKKFTQDLFDHPELGFKEFRTSKKVIDELKVLNPTCQIERFSETGIKTCLNPGKELNIAFIAELDSVYAPSHFNSDKETGAAQNCGHYTQVAIAMALYQKLIMNEDYKKWDYTLHFIFVPAEEYLDLDYRQQLVDEGKIVHFGGKPEAMRLGIFDNIDAAYCVHSIGEKFSEPTIELNCNLAGFLYKYYTFKGKATHAGFDPFNGVNAYSMSTLFNTGIGLSRQQFNDTQSIRINPIIMKSDMSTNVIPNEVTIGTDLRCQSIDYMTHVAEKLDKIAQGSAYALEGQVDITTQMGYLPFVQNDLLNDLARTVYEQTPAITRLIDDRGSIAAAGDIGDLAFMIPCAQISYGGFAGTIHGDDFQLVDEDFVLDTFPNYLLNLFNHLNGNLSKEMLYKKTYHEYKALIESI